MPVSSVVLTRSIRKGSLIFREGEEARCVYIVLRGRVVMSSAERPGIRLQPCFDGAVLGLPETVLGTKYQTSARARTAVTVHMIGREDLQEMLSNPEEGYAVVSALADKVTQIYRELKLRRFNNKHSRVAAKPDCGIKVRQAKRIVQ
jgi:CRP-like cAMP-binding protein